jgi:hypothetical protein
LVKCAEIAGRVVAPREGRTDPDSRLLKRERIPL